MQPAEQIDAETVDERLFEGDEPFALFERWFAEAQQAEPNDPNAMALATVDADGLPDVRMVLLKGNDARGFVFYTNIESAKGGELAVHPKAALLFHWKSLRRQVRIRGPVEPVSDAEADAYFASRPRGSQIGAWASAQSRPLESRAALEQAVKDLEARYGEAPPPRPDYWRGYRVEPLAIEFWRDRRSRLHDRMLFRRDRLDAAWTTVKLYP
ncbi:MAG: pyridoxamine 5'-phosphate oxidase [Caulobacteraceae bacterium]